MSIRSRPRLALGRGGELRRSRRRVPWAAVALFLGPNLLLFLAFIVGPFVYGAGISFLSWNLIDDPRWVGLGNYVNVFRDPLLGQLLWNSIWFMVAATAGLMVVGLLSALLLNREIPLRWLWRAIYFLPLVTSPVAAGAVWKWLYAKDYGLLNFVLAPLGVHPIDWLYSTQWALPAVIVMFVWRQVPMNTILYLAGLQGIPRELYEAAAIDGAGYWRIVRHVTVPLLTPTIFFAFVVTVIGLVFGSFDVISVMTQGGPLNATNVFIYNIWQNAFQYYKMGYASAEAYLVFIVVFVLSAINWRVQRWWVHY